MTEDGQPWWSALSEECPITLEPLSVLPYPPFVLKDDVRSDGDGKKCCPAAAPGGRDHYFDGLALATYVVSRGCFENPLTRAPLDYDACVRLDRYLDEHVYGNQGIQRRGEDSSISLLGSRGAEISVKEAWLLRELIKVKGDRGNGGSESERRRIDALRNEATAALRGLFVFGHQSDRPGNGDGSWQSGGLTSNSEAMAHAPGGFNLHYDVASHSNRSWGLGSIAQQEGLRVIDDDEEAHEAADAAATRAVQSEFPSLISQNPPVHIPEFSSDCPSSLLETVRRTADLTIKEDKEKTERLERKRQQDFRRALERKKNRIQSWRRAKEEAARGLSWEKEARDTLQSAREEIDRWRAQQWEEWEHSAAIYCHEAGVNNEAPNVKAPTKTDEANQGEKSPPNPKNKQLSPEERAAKAAAKKRAKRQKAKERAREKKRLERAEAEREERASALRREKERSALRCGACGEGVLGCGFEKFGATFCSTKCARKGPSSKG